MRADRLVDGAPMPRARFIASLLAVALLVKIDEIPSRIVFDVGEADPLLHIAAEAEFDPFGGTGRRGDQANPDDGAGAK